MWNSRPYRNAVELQQLMMKDARIADLKPITRAALARAYCELEECKRKLRMKPLPKAIDVSGNQNKRRGSQPRTSEGSEV